MQVNVVYLQQIASDVGLREEALTLQSDASVADLIATISTKHGQKSPGTLAAAKDGIRFKNIAINLALQRDGATCFARIDYAKVEQIKLQDKDTVLLYQPVAGG